MSDKNFVNGLVVKRNEKAPEFVICNLSFKAGDFVKYIGENSKNGWLNVDIKLSKGGKYYAEKNIWEKKEEKQETKAKQEVVDEEPIETIERENEEEILPDDIPF